MMAPHVYAMQKSPSFDPRQPRKHIQDVAQDERLPTAQREAIARAEAASLNGAENVGVFAAAVVAGNLAGLSRETLNLCSIGYIASRLVYCWLYVNNTTEAIAHARSTVFFGGVGLWMTLFVKSANVLKNRAANLL